MGMFSVSAVLMIAGSRGSYALAGAVTATGLAATALVGPWTARLVDRHGQARIAVPATVLAVLGSLSLLLCVRHGAPDWTLFASYAATATTPNTGGMSRARWAHLFRDDPAALHTANSFEQAADELCFMLGPVLAALPVHRRSSRRRARSVGAALLLTGVLLFAAQRRTEPPVTGTRRRPAPLPLRPPDAAAPRRLPRHGCGLRLMEVVTIAFADGHGMRPPAAACSPSRQRAPARPDCSTAPLRPVGPAGDRLPRLHRRDGGPDDAPAARRRAPARSPRWPARCSWPGWRPRRRWSPA